MAQDKASIIFEIKDLASAAINKVKSSLNSFADQALIAAGRADTLRDKLDGVGRIGQSLGVGLGVVAAGLGFLGLTALKTSGQFEQWNVAFETMLGSGDKAKLLMADLVDVAKKTPFNTTQVVEQTKLLLAMGISVEDLIPSIGMLGDIASGVGVDKLPQLTLAYGQIRGATRLTGMELRQFTEAGVPLIDLLGKQMGKTSAEIQDMVYKGQVGFTDVRNALASTTKEGGKFFQAMEKQSKTMGGMWTNLEDTVTELARKIGDELAPAAKFFIGLATKIVAVFTNMNPTLRTTLVVFAGIIAGFAALATGLGAVMFVVPAVASGLALIASGLAAVGVAGTAATLGLPILVAAVVSLGVAIAKNWEMVQLFGVKIAKGFVDSSKLILESIQVVLDKLNALAAKIPGIPKVNLNVKGAISALDNVSKHYDETMANLSKEIATKQTKTTKSVDTSSREFTQKVDNAKANDGADQKKAFDLIMQAHDTLMKQMRATNTYTYDDELARLEAIRSTYATTAEERLKIDADMAQLKIDRNKEFDRVELENNKQLLDEKMANEMAIFDQSIDLEIERQRQLILISTMSEKEKAKALNALRDASLKTEKERISFAKAAYSDLGNTQLSIQEQVSKGTLNLFKNEANRLVDIWLEKSAFQLVADGIAHSIETFGGSLLVAAAQAAPLVAAGAAAKTAINSVQLAEGGIALPRPGGIQATIAEAGQAEAVIPLDRLSEFIGAGENVVHVYLDGEQIARSNYRHTKRLERTGQLTGGV